MNATVTFSNQIAVARSIRKTTGLDVYFDGDELVDAKTSNTICADCFRDKSIDDLIDAVHVYKK